MGADDPESSGVEAMKKKWREDAETKARDEFPDAFPQHEPARRLFVQHTLSQDPRTGVTPLDDVDRVMLGSYHEDCRKMGLKPSKIKEIPPAW